MSENRKNKIIKTVIIIAVIAGSVVGSYFLICLLWNTDTPITVVQGVSMEPTLYQGDLLFVKKPRDLGDIQAGSHENFTGDILIYKSPIRGFLVVHRVIDKKFENNTWYFRTQGDNNWHVDDGMLYTSWLHEDYVKGIMIGVIPWIGNIGIFLRDSGIGIFLIIIIIGYIIISSVFESKPEEQEEKKKENDLEKDNLVDEL